MKITKSKLILGLNIWWLVFVVLFLRGTTNSWVLNTVGFSFLLFVPGFLTVLIAKFPILPLWIKLSFSVAFSLLELMLIVLIGNEVLPLFGVARPLDAQVILGEVIYITVILSVIAWVRLEKWEVKVSKVVHSVFPSTLNTVFTLIPIIFVVQSIFGATSLNNNGTGLWTLAMIGEIGIFVLIVAHMSKRLEESTLAAILFLLGLSLLFMTSLRGWYVTGHDIQQEFKVFELAKNAGIWTMSSFRDSYNACLSITILPTIFYNLLKISDPYVYKIFYQIIFALCPSVVYFICRRWLNRKMSFLATLYFIAFPTFFADMPFLARQEIAFLFYGLMIYIIFQERVSLRKRRILFVLMGIGVIFSHYSTTYTILAIFLLSSFSMPVFSVLLRVYLHRPSFSDSALDIFSPKHVKINIVMSILLLSVNFMWTAVITKTNGNFSKVLRETYLVTINGFTEGSRSVDVSSLISFTKPSQDLAILNYIKNTVEPMRTSTPPGVYYDKSLFNGITIKGAGSEALPLTPLGQFASRYSANVGGRVIFLGELLAKLMELAIPIGIVFILFRSSILEHMDCEFYLLAIYSLFFVVANIVLPILSTEYGVFRAIQQSMFVLAPFMAIGSVVIAWPLISGLNFFHKIITPAVDKAHLLSIDNNVIPVILALSFFLYSTSFIPQLFGGNNPQLHLNNAGTYYDQFLTQTTEVQGFEWLVKATNIVGSTYTSGMPDVQADRFFQNKGQAISDIHFLGDIFPLLLEKNAYVFLDKENVIQMKSSIKYNGDDISYAYPISFLDDNKNLIYNSGEVRTYK